MVLTMTCLPHIIVGYRYALNVIISISAECTLLIPIRCQLLFS